jgi:hypothetical protein
MALLLQGGLDGDEEGLSSRLSIKNTLGQKYT